MVALCSIVSDTCASPTTTGPSGEVGVCEVGVVDLRGEVGGVVGSNPCDLVGYDDVGNGIDGCLQFGGSCVNIVEDSNLGGKVRTDAVVGVGYSLVEGSSELVTEGVACVLILRLNDPHVVNGGRDDGPIFADFLVGGNTDLGHFARLGILFLIFGEVEEDATPTIHFDGTYAEVVRVPLDRHFVAHVARGVDAEVVACYEGYEVAVVGGVVVGPDSVEPFCEGAAVFVELAHVTDEQVGIGILSEEGCVFSLSVAAGRVHLREDDFRTDGVVDRGTCSVRPSCVRTAVVGVETAVLDIPEVQCVTAFSSSIVVSCYVGKSRRTGLRTGVAVRLCHGACCHQQGCAEKK